MTPLVDTHCHLDYIVREGQDPEAVWQAAQEAGIEWIVNPAVHPDQFPDIVALAERFEGVYAAAAVHPTDVQLAGEDWQRAVLAMLEHPKTIAIGETGLDYYHDMTYVPQQQAAFRQFLAWGRERNLPVIIHDREAHADVAAIVDEYPGVRGVMHCFSGDVAFAQAMIDKGFAISLAGNVTFKNAQVLHDVARDIPLEHLLIETDAPFLSPMPFRGKPNVPERVQYVAQKIAELKGESVETVAEVTTANARRVFFGC